MAAGRIALVGHPNVGKSVVFNRLTGSYVTVSNYPGTTVDVTRGIGRLQGRSWQVIDTPGVRSLTPQSEDELASRDLLLRERPDVVIQVADAKNLKQTLMLTAALADLGLPMVLALNMSDEAESRGYHCDVRRLSGILGIPVVQTVATAGAGLEELKACLSHAARANRVEYCAEIESALRRLKPAPASGESDRFVGLALLSGDEGVCGCLPHADPEKTGGALVRAQELRRDFVRPPEFLVHAGREAWAMEVVGEVQTRSRAGRPGWLQTLDKWSMRGLPGYALAAGTLLVMYYFVGVLAAGHGVDFMENTLFGEYLNPTAVRWVRAAVPSPFLQDMLVGEYGIVTMALTYALAIVFPIVTAFFLFFGCLEDSGYLPRLSAMLDKAFRLVGLNGKAVIPMVLGLGCDTMATLSTRILDSRKERLLATMLLTLGIPCSAQLGVIMGILAKHGLREWAVWLAAVGGTTLAAGWAASKLLPGARSPFIMEIPPLRIPEPGNILLKIKIRLVWYLKEAVPLFMLGTLALFLFDRIGVLKRVEVLLAPVTTTLLGLPSETAWCFILGFLRRDYGAAGLFTLAEKGALDSRQIVVSLVAITLFMPCLAQFLVMVKERGARAACFISAFVFATAFAVGAALNQFLAFTNLL
ncbi:MAG: ferrous iron transport protein B [Elusimicrobia bacterium GWA2_69_24]|nr:MAG: ferrous iron transport protein B [Elusimicrobia bacterium GWA2_69_24]